MKTKGFSSVKEWLKKINLTLSDDSIAQLFEVMRSVNYKKGEHLTNIGDVENRLYFITSGVARAYFTHDNEEYSFRFFFDNEFTSAYFSFITRTPSEDGLQALSNLHAYCLDYDSLEKISKANPEIQLLRQKSIEYFYLEKINAQKQLLCLTAEERYKELVDNEKNWIQEIPLKHLATFLGIKPVVKTYEGRFP